MARRVLAAVALLALAVDQAFVAWMPSSLSTKLISSAFAVGLVAAAAGVLMRYALARWIALGASLAGLAQAAILSGWWLSFEARPPLSLVAVGVACGLVASSLWGSRMARLHNRGLRGALWAADTATPRWLAASVIGAAAAVPMLLVYAYFGPWWLSPGHRLIAWSLAIGFATAASLIALERTAGVILLAPLGVMTAALVLDGSLWLANSPGGPLGGIAAVTTATFAPLLFAATTSLGTVAHLARPMARFLTSPRPCPTSANALPILARQRD